MAAHRESQEFNEEEVAQFMASKHSPDKGSPIPSHVAGPQSDTVERSGSFRAENNTTPVRQRTASGGSHHQSSGLCGNWISLHIISRII